MLTNNKKRLLSHILFGATLLTSTSASAAYLDCKACKVHCEGIHEYVESCAVSTKEMDDDIYGNLCICSETVKH